MTALTLYELTDQYREALDALTDLIGVDDAAVADTLEGLQGTIQAKATNVAMLARNLEANAEAIGEAINAMTARQKALQAKSDWLQSYLLGNMVAAGMAEISCPYFAIKVQNNPPKVVVDAEGAIPAQYWTQKPPVTPPPALDKKAIADAIKAGAEIPGVHLEQGKRLVIK